MNSTDGRISPRLRRLGAVLLAGVAPAALMAGAVHAQVAPSSAAAAPAKRAGRIEEVTVTASRRTQNLQKVSASVSVIQGASIKAQGLANLGQIFASLPSVQATSQPGGFSVDIRGLGGDLPAGTTQGSSALVIDGVYQINSQSTTVGFFDTNRIEVLQGPQSTRFGPNADGGIVNVISNDPVLGRYTGEAALTVGNYNLVRGELAVNLPISDTLAVRLAGAGITRNSYFSPAEGNAKDESFRGKVLWKPRDNLTFKLTYELDHVGGTGNGSNAFPVFTNKVPVYSGGSINDLANPWGQAPSNPQNINSANIFQHTVIGDVTYQISPAIVLDAIGSFTKLTGHENATIFLPPWSTTASEGPVIQNARLLEFDPFNQYTGEIRFHNGPDQPIKWDIGYYHWNYANTYALLNAAFLSAPPVRTATDTNAIYSEMTYPITPQLRLVGGLRESFDHREFDFNNSGVVTPTFSINFSHFDYRAGVEYDVLPHSMLYATVSSGYRPGGLSAFNPVTNAPNSFQSEVNRAYEIGAKNRFLDNRLQLNGSAFYYDISNYQNLDKYTGFVPVTGGAPCGNGDTRAGCQTPTFGLAAQSFGEEVDALALITPDDSLKVSATFLQANFNKKQHGCATVAAPTGGCYDGYNSEAPFDSGAPQFFALGGAVQPHSPKAAIGLSYTHTFDFASGATLAVGGDGFYTTGYWVNPVEDSARYGFQPSYVLGNLNATFVPAGGHFTVTAFARNLGDYAVKQSVLPATSIGDPQTYGVTIGYKW